MFDPKSFDLLQLDEIIESYDYQTDPVLRTGFRRIEEALWSAMEHYGEGVNNFGRQLTEHLRRTSLDCMSFMVEELGFSEKAGWNFHAANLFQDLGKIHPGYDPRIWDLPHRPTVEERAEKNLHMARGPEVFAVALERASPEVLAHPHVRIVIPAIQLFHHERADGKGTFGKTSEELGLLIKSICIADAKDGDMILRGHQSFQRSETEALLRLKGLPEHDENGKYVGAFDGLLDRYIRYRERVSGRAILGKAATAHA